MKSNQIRPVWTINSKLSPDEVFMKLKEKVQRKDSPVIGNISTDSAFFRVPAKEKKFWNPELQVSVTKRDNLTIVKGRIGPTPKVWTSFIFGYGFTIILSIFGGMYGFIQYYLGYPAPWLLSFPVAIVFALLVFVTAKTGQYLAQDQMRILRAFLNNAIIDNDLSRN